MLKSTVQEVRVKVMRWVVVTAVFALFVGAPALTPSAHADGGVCPTVICD